MARKRIALTRRLDDVPGAPTSGPREDRSARDNARGGPRHGGGNARPPKPTAPPADNALAAAFARARGE